MSKLNATFYTNATSYKLNANAHHANANADNV